MEDYSRKIYLKDLISKNIYVRLDQKIQKELFSKFSFKDFNLSPSKFSHYKLKNLAFPLELLLSLLKKANLKECFIYKHITEIKRGQRSKPFFNPKFPIRKDSYYWNVLFALFCDGSSDQWCSAKNKKMELPAYTSYSNEIRNSLIKLVKHRFGNFKYKVYDGSVKLPPVLDVYFKSQHDINSFNTKSFKIPQFTLTEKFKNELLKLDGLNKIAVLVRYLVDEGDKSKISLNPRSINLAISSTSRGLIDILKIVLDSLKISYHTIYRKRKENTNKWKDSYMVQIRRGKNRNNLKLLNFLISKLNKKYKLISLTALQKRCLEKAIKYKLKNRINNLNNSKEVNYLIYKFLLNRNRVTFKEINGMLISHNFNLNMCSILHVLGKMPIISKISVIYVDKEKLESYLPYSKEDIADANYYRKAIYLYQNGEKVSDISNKFNIPWSTIKSWISGRAKPSILHGKWVN